MKLPVTLALATFTLSIATATVALAASSDHGKTQCGGDEKKDDKKDDKS